MKDVPKKERKSSAPLPIEEIRLRWPGIDSVPEPDMVGLFVGNGVGSKLLQGYLDGAPDLYMIPAYPLVYLYPHWRDWEKIPEQPLTWERAVDLFCEKHASVIDSRRIPGFNGLRSLGRAKNEHIGLNEDYFRTVLRHFLGDKPVESRTFILAVHYAYALACGETLDGKKVLLYHVHNRQYLPDLLRDFPQMKAVTMTRDPRSNFPRRLATSYKLDAAQMTASDTFLFRAMSNYYCTRYIFEDNQIIAGLVAPERLKVVRHEDFGQRLEPTIRALCAWLGLSFSPELLKVTFGGKEWWGDNIYDMPPTNEFFGRVLSKDWMKDKGFVEWFVHEGLLLDILQKYGYPALRYTSDGFFSRAALFFMMLLPTRVEAGLLFFYLNPLTFARMFSAALSNASGSLPIKDYTWSGTYLYKWSLIEFRLWETRPHVRWLQASRRLTLKTPRTPAAPILNAAAQVIYVLGQTLRYGCAVLRLPVVYARSRRIFLSRFIERLGGSAPLPDLLIEWDGGA